MSIENGNATAPEARRPSIGRGFWVVLAVTVIAVGLAGAFAKSAFSEDWGWHGPMRGPGFGFGPGMMMGDAVDPATVDDRIQRMVGHLAIEIDATDEQKQKLTAIFVGAAHDLLPLREKIGHGAAAGELVDLLTQPTVDSSAVEAFRADKIALADQASRRVTQALVDAADVLTPEQRQKIGDELRFFAKFGPPFHHG